MEKNLAGMYEIQQMQVSFIHFYLRKNKILKIFLEIYLSIFYYNFFLGFRTKYIKRIDISFHELISNTIFVAKKLPTSGSFLKKIKGRSRGIE